MAHLTHLQTGTGQPLLLLGDLGFPLEAWEPEFIERLGEEFMVVATAWPAIDSVREMKSAMSLEGLAERVGDFCLEHDLRSVYLLGLGLGAEVALELAWRYPQRIRRLVLVAARPAPRRYPGPENAIRLFQDRVALRANPRRWLQDYWEGSFSDVWIQEKGAPLFTRLEPALDMISGATVENQLLALNSWPGRVEDLAFLPAATLVINGMEDIFVPPRNATFLESRLRYGRLSLIEGAGHGVLNQFPLLCASQVEEFLLDPLEEA